MDIPTKYWCRHTKAGKSIWKPCAVISWEVGRYPGTALVAIEGGSFARVDIIRDVRHGFECPGSKE